MKIRSMFCASRGRTIWTDWMQAKQTKMVLRLLSRLLPTSTKVYGPENGSVTVSFIPTLRTDSITLLAIKHIRSLISISQCISSATSPGTVESILLTRTSMLFRMLCLSRLSSIKPLCYGAIWIRPMSYSTRFHTTRRVRLLAFSRVKATKKWLLISPRIQSTGSISRSAWTISTLPSASQERRTSSTNGRPSVMLRWRLGTLPWPRSASAMLMTSAHYCSCTLLRVMQKASGTWRSEQT